MDAGIRPWVHWCSERADEHDDGASIPLTMAVRQKTAARRKLFGKRSSHQRCAPTGATLRRSAYPSAWSLRSSSFSSSRSTTRVLPLATLTTDGGSATGGGSATDGGFATEAPAHGGGCKRDESLGLLKLGLARRPENMTRSDSAKSLPPAGVKRSSGFDCRSLCISGGGALASVLGATAAQFLLRRSEGEQAAWRAL